jgi:hypothetical protein
MMLETPFKSHIVKRSWDVLSLTPHSLSRSLLAICQEPFGLSSRRFAGNARHVDPICAVE